MTGYGEVVRETAAERHERLIEAIVAVLADWGDEGRFRMTPAQVRMMAEECLAAAEAGF